jgi:prolipoprotein diacylglyceryltransferase
LSVGSWSYTAALRAILNHGPLAHRFDLAMLLAILGGAIVGGRIGKVAIKQATRSSLLENARHLGGGLLMGLGGGLVPGGNDQLILFNAPLLEPFAWLALTTMTLTILVCLAFERRSAAASPCPIDTTQ